MKRNAVLVLLALLLVAAVASLALREGRHRPPPPPEVAIDPAALATVQAAYARDVEPTFKQACFDCHSTHTVWPWYHALPGVRQFLDGHVEDGRRALDMDRGFPFHPGARGLRDLVRVAGAVERGDMPLATYRLMHPLARLSDDQKDAVVAWARGSYDLLTTTARPLSGTAAAGGPGR